MKGEDCTRVGALGVARSQLPLLLLALCIVVSSNVNQNRWTINYTDIILFDPHYLHCLHRTGLHHNNTATLIKVLHRNWIPVCILHVWLWTLVTAQVSCLVVTLSNRLVAVHPLAPSSLEPADLLT